MTPSIRRVLLVNLLLSITITTSLTAIGNFFLDQKGIEHHLDAMLIQTGLTIQTLMTNRFTREQINNIQLQLDKVPERSLEFYKAISQDNQQPHYHEKFQFQVWTREKKLLMHSPNAPTVPLSDFTAGLSEKYIHHRPWRVFTIAHAKFDATIVVAERYDIRSSLAHKMARDDIYIMILIYPLLGLLIWIVISRGLRSIKRVTHEVAHRAPTYLEPVDLKSVPVEIKPLIDELNKLFLRIQQGFEREKRFTADAAHELRTPLAGLRTHAELASRSQTEERHKALKNVLKSVDRCSHIIHQLLTLSRMHPDVAILEETTQVNLVHEATEIIATSAADALAKNIEIELITDQKKALINGSETALGILVRNLVDNAIRYTPENGQVRVTINTDLDTVVLKVEDNGPGIPAELRARVFERFYRVLGTKVSGSGLGLAIVQQIAKLHAGELTLGTGENGKGLLVTVVFPKAT